ncbi:MAG: hypothetical protein CR972_02130 [Candidatus Moraniibacteriota bacterium]|nr:MAG: hypothetical protein CR972_02130 [Candidatus Moranbacteria bacterium]
MFFLYLIIFIVIVSTPFIINGVLWIFSEDELEAIILLCAGVVSFMIYRLKDYQVFENIRDRVKLQQSFARAQKELSESYSYIGQANRRTDIMYEIFSDLSHMNRDGHKDGVIRAMEMLPYTDNFSFRFIKSSKGKACKKFGSGSKFGHLPDTLFCRNTNTRSYREQNILFVYSEVEEHDLRACIAVPFSKKAENDIDFFKALTAYFTMVYVFHDESCAENLTNV